MSSDRERIIEFDASTSIPADGWLAIDSTTEGTRKIQKSAIIGSGSLDTTSQEVIGAINEVNARAATVESMTQAEYDALPDTKLSDNVVRYITDGEPTYDETLWNKVGTDPLDTTAQDCSGAINEIKSSLSNLGGDGYTAPPSGSYATNVSYGAGGYCRIGKIIILNLRIGLSQNISANTTLVSNLPIPNANANIVSVMNNRKADITLGTSGQITTADGLNAGNVILSCVYLTSN